MSRLRTFLRTMNEQCLRTVAEAIRAGMVPRKERAMPQVTRVHVTTCALALGVAVWLGAAVVTFSHNTGHESRTPAQCELLPGTATGGERGQCLRCVTRPKPHHYHPDYPAGNRCRPDNGQP